MLSRVANLAYWTARLLERAENNARIIDVNAQLALDLRSHPEADEARTWKPMISVSGGQDLFSERYPDGPSEANVVDFIIFDRKNPNSIASCVSQARENCRCIRDQISSEVYEQINRLHLRMRRESYAEYRRLGASEYLNRVKASIELFYGIADAMLPRTELWWFFELGRFLERADNVSRIIDVKYFTLLPETQSVGGALDTVQWAAVLRSCSGFEAFRKSRRGQLTLDRAVDYLVLDQYFPRSICFAIAQADNALRRITGDPDHHYTNTAARTLARLRADLECATIGEIIAEGLHEYIDRLQVRIAEVHESVHSTFIAY